MKKTYDYENIQIGNFLVSIGYYLRDLNYSHPVVLSLNQQTPNDPTLGDLFGSFSGSSFLIEFKSHEKNLGKEINKPARKLLVESLENDFSDLVITSEKAHFICYPSIVENKMDFNLRPYIYLPNDKLIISNVKKFIKMTIVSQEVGATYEEIKKYITLLEKCSKDAGHRDSSGVSSGILMNFDKVEGIKYLLYEGIDKLNLKLGHSNKIENKTKKRLSNDGNAVVTKPKISH